MLEGKGKAASGAFTTELCSLVSEQSLFFPYDAVRWAGVNAAVALGYTSQRTGIGSDRRTRY